MPQKGTSKEIWRGVKGTHHSGVHQKTHSIQENLLDPYMLLRVLHSKYLPLRHVFLRCEWGWAEVITGSMRTPANRWFLRIDIGHRHLDKVRDSAVTFHYRSNLINTERRTVRWLKGWRRFTQLTHGLQDQCWGTPQTLPQSQRKPGSSSSPDLANHFAPLCGSLGKIRLS